MKAKPEAVDDLRSLRDALDAPARAKVEVAARERDAEQRQRQDGLLAYARRIAKDLEPAVAAKAAWDATPVDVAALRKTFGELVPVWRASDAVNSGSRPIEDAVGVAGEVARLVTELERPALLPPARLAAILPALEHAAGTAEGFLPIYAAWIRVREDGLAELEMVQKLYYALRRRWKPTEAERALLARQQEHLAAAAAAMPPIPPPRPRKGISGADFDATATTTSAPHRLLENDL